MARSGRSTSLPIERQEAERLERELREANEAYHERGESPMSDEGYDAGLERLAALDPDNPFLGEVGSPVAGRDAVDLPRRMGSLEKKRTDDQLRRAMARHGRAARTNGYVLSDKLDGQSALLHASPSGIRMYSRGDGLRGRDISRFVSAIDGIPPDVAERMRRAGVEFVRGELVVPRAARPGAEGSLLRNFVTGVINSGSPSEADLSLVRFVAYEACPGAGAPCARPSEQLAAIAAAGIVDHVAHHGAVAASDATSESLAATLVARKAASEYAMDGIVLAVDAAYEHDGSAAYPSHAFAFKSPLAESGARTRVSGIEWNLTRRGRLAPTLLVEEVSLNGSRVRRASGKSARHVIDGGLGVGAEVELVMAGDVIPDVRRVVRRSDDVPPPEGVEYAWDANRVHYVSGSPAPAAALAHLFSSLPVKGFGPSAAGRLAAAGFRDAFAVLGATDAALDAALGGGRGAALRRGLGGAVASADPASLAHALGLLPQGVGRRTASLAIRSGRTSAAGLEGLDGIGPETAPRVALGLERLAEAERRLAEAGLRSAGEKEGKKKKKKEKKGEGGKEKKGEEGKKGEEEEGGRALVVAFSGFRDRALEEEVEAAGGRVAGAVTASTDYLVTRDGKAPRTSKGRKAAEAGVPVVTEEGLRAAMRRRRAARQKNAP